MSADKRLRQVFADVFGIEGDSVKDDDSPDTIDGWDSVAHLTLVFALEAEFTIRFEAQHIPELVSFRAIRERVTEKEQAAG